MKNVIKWQWKMEIKVVFLCGRKRGRNEHHRMKNATDILKEGGLKKSAQRIAVINILQAKQKPLSEDAIKGEMGEIYDRITFYRTMQALCGAGIVHKIIVDNTVVEYALNAEGCPHEHVHFFCTVCHAVTCMRDVAVHRYRLPADYEQTGCEVLIKGVCPSCLKAAR